MNPKKAIDGAPFLLMFSLVGMVLLSFTILSTFRFPFPPFNRLIFDIGKDFSNLASFERPLGAEGGFRDVFGVLMGMRRLTADVGWLSVLQYYGGHEKEEEGEHHEFGGGKYHSLKKMVLRVVRLDPSFHYAYLYGAGALGWNLDRPDEALEILKEGIRYNPQYWRFRLYVGAIVYKQKGKFDEMITLLEDAVQHPDCPTMVKSILANIYEERKDYVKSLKIWIDIQESEHKDPAYIQRSEQQIKELRRKLGI